MSFWVLVVGYWLLMQQHGFVCIFKVVPVDIQVRSAETIIQLQA
jgi:hypothetical protein